MIAADELDSLYDQFCKEHCSNRHHPQHMHFSECLNCSAMGFAEWLEETAKKTENDHK